MEENNKNSRREYLKEKKRARDEQIKKRAMARIIFFSAIVLAVAIGVTTALFVKTDDISGDTKVRETELPIVVLEPSPSPETYEEEVTDAEEAYIPEEYEIVKGNMSNTDTAANTYTSNGGGKIIVLDAGHGKSSSAMSESEKINEGYIYNESRGSWGEWRHYKSGTCEECGGSGCTQTGPGCWYPMGNGDRSTEPELTLANALAAKSYLEQMGYTVRMTRTSNDENPSMTKRVSYCYPNNNASSYPDASLYVCIHSNAGGGSGTSYISLEDTYTQKYIPSNFVSTSNNAGNIINSSIANNCSLSARGPIGGEGYLILFNKCPVPIAYLEIGFYDNSSDLSILRSQSDAIGKGIAEGVDKYLSGN